VAVEFFVSRVTFDSPCPSKMSKVSSFSTGNVLLCHHRVIFFFSRKKGYDCMLILHVILDFVELDLQPNKLEAFVFL